MGRSGQYDLVVMPTGSSLVFGAVLMFVFGGLGAASFTKNMEQVVDIRPESARFLVLI